MRTNYIGILHRLFPEDIAIIKQSGRDCIVTNRYGEVIFQEIGLFLHNRHSIECKAIRLYDRIIFSFENKGSGVIYITDESRKHAVYEGDGFQWYVRFVD